MKPARDRGTGQQLNSTITYAECRREGTCWSGLSFPRKLIIDLMKMCPLNISERISLDLGLIYIFFIATLAPSSWIVIQMGWQCKDPFAVALGQESICEALITYFSRRRGEQLSMSRNLCASSLEAKMVFRVIG